MRNKGFTILEVVIATTIMVGVVLGAGAFARDILNLNRSATQSLIAQSDARRVLKSAVAELRTASPSDTGAYAIESAATSSLIFFADIDGDGRAERLRYFLDPETRTLKRGVVVSVNNPPEYVIDQETTSTLAEGLSFESNLPIFEYFDTNYDGTTEPLSYPLDVSVIRLVRITVTIDKDPNKLPGPQTIFSEVTLRNLKDNL